jgi:Glycosyltransferase family 87
LGYAHAPGELVFDRVRNARPAWLERGVGIAALAVVAAAMLLDLAIRNDPISVDFHTYLAAARVGMADGWAHIYDQAAVAAEQHRLAPSQPVQPYLSPPIVAFLVAPLAALPVDVAYVVWAALTLAILAAALTLCATSAGIGRWVAVIGAVAPWWVMHAINLGQVVPLVAAGMVVGWRLLRDRRDALAGVALAAMLLKPNTAVLVPLALLFAARYRALVTWLATAAVAGLGSLLLLGPAGVGAYLAQLSGPLPAGADNLTLHGALGASGGVATALRVVIVVVTLAAVYAARREGAAAIPLALVASLLISPYLHASDLCVLAVAAWMAWEDHPTPAWRVSLAAAWVLASPFLYLVGRSPGLNRWPWLEIAILLGLVITALLSLTGTADPARRAPA